MAISGFSIFNIPQAIQWATRFDSTFSRLEKIEKNGLHSLLKRELTSVMPLFYEGQKIVNSRRESTPLSTAINDLVENRLNKLNKVFLEAQKKMAQEPKFAETDLGIEKKWEKLGLPSTILENHADCARFLIESGLVFTIIAYRETCKDGNLHNIKLDNDGHPMIKVQGNFMRWEVISKELEYDSKSEKIKSRNYPGDIAQTWNYFHPNGLVPIDRFNYDKVYPIYQLSEADYQKVLSHSGKFYETNEEKDVGIKKDCIVQFFTSARQQGIPNHPLLNNLKRNFPVHISIRLITADRNVYSFGYQIIAEDQNTVLSNVTSTLGTTALTKVSMFDYEECRPHEGRKVTSLPASSQRAQNIIDFLNDLNQKQLRFQFGRQNCSVLMHEVMQRLGYEVNTRTTIGASFLDMLPYLNQFPLIGGLIKKVELFAQKMWNQAPRWITKPLGWTRNVICYIPEKIGTILMNLVHLKLGGAKKTAPLPEGVPEEVLYDKKGIQQFSSVIRSWTDIFKDETSVISHSKFFIDWQDKQKSTFIEPAGDLPKLAIVSNER